MKRFDTDHRNRATASRSLLVALTLASISLINSDPVLADETCVSPYMTRIEGQEEFIAFTATALTSKIWLVHEDAKGEWQAKEVAPIGGEKGVLPVDISLSADDRTLFVSCFGDGKCRVFDVSDPHQPRQIHEQAIGRQVHMVSQSWDGKRLYFTSSLLANWDKQGEDNEQFLRAYDWNGHELKPAFLIDFTKEKLGRPHAMNFGSTQLYN